MMKTIGLIGGMSWESTVMYYQIINEVVKEQRGGLHSAKILLYSVDFQEIEECQAVGNWNKSAEILGDVAVNLERGGADFIVICTNTMHKVAPIIQQRIRIPIIHIADATSKKLIESGIDHVALLGTKYTLTEDFYKEKLITAGIHVLIPDEDDIQLINHIIYEELCLGIISQQSKNEYLRVINQLQKQGAQGVILGCTEIGLLIKQEDTNIPVFDTTQIHGTTAALFALEK